MVSDFVTLITYATSHVSDWMIEIFNACEAGLIYVGIVTCYLLIRFFLWPAFGHGAGSDIARSGRDRKSLDYSASSARSLSSGSTDIAVR